jgi:ParB-like chromosome segregation protein Spo0J
VRAASALKEKMETKEFHPVADLFPLMGDEELLALADDIKANGLLEPIWLGPDGRIIDGRNRYRACELAEVEPAYRNWDGQGSLVRFAVSLNLHRRHLNEAARAAIAAQIANMEEGRPKETVEISTVSISQTEAGEMLNVGRDSVIAAKRILNEGTPEEVAALKAGEVAVNTLAKDIRNGVPVELRGKNKPRARSLGPKLTLPEGKTAEEWVREGLALSEAGKSGEEVMAHLGLSNSTWARARDIVRLCDREDLSTREGEKVRAALADMNATRQVSVAYEMVREIAERIWGSATDRRGASGSSEKRRLETFEHALAVIVQMGRSADALAVPHFTKQRAEEVAASLHAVALSINALRRRIMEIHQ